jgi:hypothetical protein
MLCDRILLMTTKLTWSGDTSYLRSMGPCRSVAYLMYELQVALGKKPRP